MIVDPTLSVLLTSALENVINKALKHDPATRHKLTALEGKQLKLACTEPSLNLYFTVHEKAFHVGSENDLDNDVEISGKLTDLIKLVIQGDDSMVDSGVSISGKLSVLTEYQNIFKHIDIDWEEPINDLLGPVIGHTLAQGLRTSGKWLYENAVKTKENIPDLLTDELQLVPSKPELETFYQNVDTIRSDVSRVSARIQSLRNKIHSAS